MLLHRGFVIVKVQGCFKSTKCKKKNTLKILLRFFWHKVKINTGGPPSTKNLTFQKHESELFKMLGILM